MKPEERELLLTVARILRANLRSRLDCNETAYMLTADWADLDLALKPFEAEITEPTNEASS